MNQKRDDIALVLFVSVVACTLGFAIVLVQSGGAS